MKQTSRRNVLAGTGAGAAGAAMIGLSGRADAATPRSTSSESVVAWVEDPRAGTVRVLSGEDETVVTDHDLVARIMRAKGGK